MGNPFSWFDNTLEAQPLKYFPGVDMGELTTIALEGLKYFDEHEMEVFPKNDIWLGKMVHDQLHEKPTIWSEDIFNAMKNDFEELVEEWNAVKQV